jgi:hypothetical protein
MSTLEFYNQRAAACRRDADSTRLANVRVRCLNAAAAWDNMAERVRRTESYRQADAARKMAEGRTS